MVLVNGCSGIGTGWSTNVPCHNPRDIIANLKRLLEGEPQQPLHPWYAGFKGKITPDPEKKRYHVSGIWKRIDARTIEITELPVGVWTQDYKEHLLGMINPDPAKKQPPFLLKDMKEYHTDQSVHFIIESEEDFPSDEVVDKVLKLTSFISVNNMTMFDSEGRIRQWESATAILDEFYTLRLQYYDKRREYLVETLREEWKRLDNKVRFILAVVNKEIIISNRKKADLLKELREKNFDPFPTKTVKTKTKVAGDEVAVESDDENEEGGEQEKEEDTKDTKKAPSVEKSSKDYDYLLSMSLWNLTLEKVQELVRQRDTKHEELKGTSTLSSCLLPPSRIKGTDKIYGMLPFPLEAPFGPTTFNYILSYLLFIVLLNTSAKQLWHSDLDELSKALDERDAQYAEDQDRQKSLKKKGGSKLKARKRRAPKPKDSDDDDYAEKVCNNISSPCPSPFAIRHSPFSSFLYSFSFNILSNYYLLVYLKTKKAALKKPTPAVPKPSASVSKPSASVSKPAKSGDEKTEKKTAPKKTLQSYFSPKAAGKCTSLFLSFSFSPPILQRSPSPILSLSL